MGRNRLYGRLWSASIRRFSPLDVMPRGRNQLIENARVDRRFVGENLDRGSLDVASAQLKKRLAASASRRAQMRTPMTWRC